MAKRKRGYIHGRTRKFNGKIFVYLDEADFRSACSKIIQHYKKQGYKYFRITVKGQYMFEAYEVWGRKANSLQKGMSGMPREKKKISHQIWRKFDKIGRMK